MKHTITFDSLLTDESLKKILHSMGIEKPTPVQERAMPLITDKKDVVCQSSTGSGKTLAFALPIAEALDISKGLQVLVLVPTRELCVQVTEAFRQVSDYKKINILEVYGGVSISNQIRAIPTTHIIVATPGRMRDLMNRRALRLDTIKTVVLDEADRMLDMGFVKDVSFILRATSRQRQTLMFSATLPRAIQPIIEQHMRNPQVVKTKEQVDKNLLKQFYYVVPIKERFHLLVHLLRNEKASYAIVFCGTRKSVDLVAHNLNKNGIDAKAIHGGLTQAMRNKIMSSFHGKTTRILVASDVAARGIDIKMLTHVYNFDVPKTSEEYVHRIGRTARAGEEGVAITLVSDKDFDNFRRVQRDPSLKIDRLEPPEVPHVRFSPLMRRDSHDRPRYTYRPNKRQGSRFSGRRFKKKESGSRKKPRFRRNR